MKCHLLLGISAIHLIVLMSGTVIYINKFKLNKYGSMECCLDSTVEDVF